jgi:AAA domain
MDGYGMRAGGEIVSIDSLEARAPEWLWPGYLLRGGVNLIVGAKGIGKTSLACWLAARASVGDERFGGRPLRVFIDSQEDDPRVVLRPRVEAAGADMARLETRRPGRSPWKFPRDLERLNGYLERRSRARRPVDLIVLDSLAAYLSRFTQAESAGETLEALTLLCQRFGCALVFVHHFNKHGRTLEAAIGGAGAITRVARTVFVFGAQPTDLVETLIERLAARELDLEPEETRVLACQKLNVAAKPSSLRFVSTVVSIPAVERVHRLQLIGETATSAEALFERARRPADDTATRTEIETAIGWLLTYLGDGARPTRRLVTDAKADGISGRTLERARARLHCQPIHPAQLPGHLGEQTYTALPDEERNGWWLRLPEFPDAPPPEWTQP